MRIVYTFRLQTNDRKLVTLASVVDDNLISEFSIIENSEILFGVK